MCHSRGPLHQIEKQIEKKSFSRELKLETVKRMEAGESSSALSKELSVKRTKLYRWRDIVRRDGEKAFSGKPAPRTKAKMLAREHGAEGRIFECPCSAGWKHGFHLGWSWNGL